MKAGTLVLRTYGDMPRPIGLILKNARTLGSDWWLVRWSHRTRESLMRTKFLKIL